MQKLAHFKNKNIAVLGAGLTGLSCVRFLQKNNLPCAVNDSREEPTNLIAFKENFPKVNLFVGSWNTQLISSADILIVSPGVDLNEVQKAHNIKSTCEVIGDVELYCQLSNTPIIAVTGSNGKSTVVSLLHYLGKQLGYKTQLGGNIGIPVLDTINETFDYLILELSSFQLETLNSMQALAATILNISDDHLDRHKTIENYSQIKQKIYAQAAVAVINRDDSATYYAKSSTNSQQISFGSDQPEHGQEHSHFGVIAFKEQLFLTYGDEKLIALSELPLAGMHNALNYLAALALGSQAGWSLTAMVQNLAGFKGLPHRCQRVESSDGVQWINDSKATNVGATLAAIKGLSDVTKVNQQFILIAGGEGKGADFKPLKTVITQHVNLLYTIGKDGHKIAELTKNSATHCIQVSSLEEAVSLASIVVKSGDTVLLSPACASLDMFKSFAERGQVFIQAVNSVQGGKL